MSDVLSETTVSQRVAEYEARYPDFLEVWSSHSCSCCKPDYVNWGIDKLDAYRDYSSLRWLRGEDEPGELDDY